MLKRKIFMLLGLLLAVLLNVSASHNEFLNLYPDCVDNEASQIYEPNAWPKGLQLPIFPDGGDIEFLRWIYSNVDYPDVVDSTVRQPDGTNKVYRAKGTVKIHITVDRCGKAVNPVVVKSVNEKYDKAALALMDELPIFKPGVLDGYRVKVGLIVPVAFTRNHIPVKDEWNGSWDDSSGSDDGGGSSGSDDGWGGYDEW